MEAFGKENRGVDVFMSFLLLHNKLLQTQWLTQKVSNIYYLTVSFHQESGSGSLALCLLQD